MISAQRIELVFRNIEQMLAKAEHITLASRSHSPFNNYLTQLSARQHKVVDHGISELRTAMICILRQYGIVANDPYINAARAVRKALADATDHLKKLAQQPDIENDSSPENVGDVAKLLRQMTDVFVYMDHALAAADSVLDKKESET